MNYFPIHNRKPSIEDTLKILNGELAALYEISKLIGTAISLEKSLSEILHILHKVLNMQRATMVLLDRTGKQLRIRTSYGLTAEEQMRGVYNLDEGIIGKVFTTSLPFVVPDINKEPLFLNKTGARPRFEKGQISFIGVPIMILQKPAGVLTVDRLFGPEISFEEDVKFLTVVATLVAQFLQLNDEINLKEECLIDENRSLKAELDSIYNRHNIIGNSKAMRDVLTIVEKVASTNATVLLLGESGTGKELVARAIHQTSPRKEKGFIKVNCAALPENLLESELFGHEKGAFTGAFSARKGRFELADGGTLFLDEIGEMGLNVQAKLLRVLQEQRFERLGGERTIEVDVRVIAATNRSLEQAVINGIFRTDLYYRLNVVPIKLPPLRDRPEDIPALIGHFLDKSNARNHKNVKISREALQFLQGYSWPGNVRELQNLIERLVILSDRGYIRLSDIPSVIQAEPELITNQDQKANGTDNAWKGRTNTYGKLLDLEKNRIEEALIKHGWVQVRAARELGITQRQMGYKIKKFGLKPPWTQGSSDHLKN
ncbi:MAG: nif-specific transcriptional activator NifA [Dissulfurimicrobium hydrothermale]|uniref:nif-specific transcriptional activator NifA n=1 Tax=Dissulfurimicrobium hydrothermale TaxID=1750598 RepID=UPI003C73AA44